jgi:ribonuclease HI
VIEAAADGSSLGNPGPAGWGWFVDDGRWACGGWPRGTNNMGELMAVLDLLRQSADDPQDLRIFCDSRYVIDAVTTWIPGWKTAWLAQVRRQPGAQTSTSSSRSTC